MWCGKGVLAGMFMVDIIEKRALYLFCQIDLQQLINNKMQVLHVMFSQN